MPRRGSARSTARMPNAMRISRRSGRRRKACSACEAKMIAKLGLAALIVALAAIVVPAVAILVSLAALVLAILAGLAGDRWFTAATPIVVAVNTFLLSPTTQFYAGHMAASERTFYLVV